MNYLLFCFVMVLMIIFTLFMRLLMYFIKLSDRLKTVLWVYTSSFVVWFGFTGYYGGVNPCKQISKKQGKSSNFMECIFNIKPPQHKHMKFDKKLFSDATFGDKMRSDMIFNNAWFFLPLLYFFPIALIVFVWKWLFGGIFNSEK